MAFVNNGRPRVVLALQGGGVLGAYHIGASQALSEAGYTPERVAGISIGAINAAIIAGNPPDEGVEQLERLWYAISRPDGRGALLDERARRLFNQASVGQAILFGQPGFFTPRPGGPGLAVPGTPGATSYYDTSVVLTALKAHSAYSSAKRRSRVARVISR